MASMILCFTLFTFGSSLVLSQIYQTTTLHDTLNVHRAMKHAVKEAYLEDSMSQSYDRFAAWFLTSSPKHLDYSIHLVNFESAPKLVHFRVEAFDEQEFLFDLEAVLIEEDMK